MADPISWLAATVTSWFTGSSAAAVSASISAGTASFTTLAIYTASYATISYGVSVGLAAIARAQLPDPEGAKITRKQPRPPRQYAIGGPTRFSGAYMLRETNANNLAVVLALAEGRLHEISRVYLNDDVAVIDEDGWVLEGDDIRYGFQRVKLDWRLGLPTETHYSQLTAKFGSVWPTTARGDGIASLMMLCNHGSMEYFNRDFPNGEPIPSVVGQGVCYDWRDEAQDREDENTWQPSANPVVWLVHLEWFLYGRSWARCIEPVLDALTDEADYCDETVAKVGGTEPRYRFGGNFFSNTEPAAVRAGILASMDGWLSTNGKGQLVLKAGRYEEPTFTIPAEHIEGYTWRAFQTDEEAVNELVISYVSPEHHYTEVEADPWRDEAGITATGRIRSENLQLTWVNHPTQARRLAKRKMSRLAAPRRGQIRTGIYGLNGLGHRYIRVQNPELSSMADVVVEVMNVEVDFASGQVAFDVILADEDIDDWNPATEEGANGSAPVRYPQAPLDVPTINDVEVFYDDAGQPRLRVTATGPDRDDLSWVIGYRVSGDVAFVESSATDIDPSTPVVLESGLVPVGDLEVIVGYDTGGSVRVLMEDGDAFEISVSTDPVPAAPTELVATADGADVDLAWRNSGSLNLYTVKVFRSATSDFGDAVDISGSLGHTGVSAPQTYTDTNPGAGTWTYWIVAYSSIGAGSDPSDPDDATVYEAETLAILAEFTTPADDARAGLYNDLFLALDAAGVWSKLDGLWVMAAHDSQAARVNLIAPAGAKLTVNGAPTFTADEGYTGDGVDDYLDTGLVANALTNMDGDDLSMGTWELTNVSGNSSIGLSSLGTLLRVIPRSLGGFMGGRINASTGFTWTTATSVGLSAINRSGASAVEAYRDGAQEYTATTASLGALPAYNIWLLADGNGGSSTYAPRKIAAGFAGGSLTSTEHADLYAALNTYLTAVGAV